MLCRSCAGPLSTAVAVDEEFTDQGVQAGAECAVCGRFVPAGPAVPGEIRRWVRRRRTLLALQRKAVA